MNSLFITIMFSAFWHSQNINTDTGAQRLIIPIDYTFKSIKIYNDLLVYITEEEKNEIIVRDEDVANAIKFKVEDGVLIIHCKNSIFR